MPTPLKKTKPLLKAQKTPTRNHLANNEPTPNDAKYAKDPDEHPFLLMNNFVTFRTNFVTRFSSMSTHTASTRAETRGTTNTRSIERIVTARTRHIQRSIWKHHTPAFPGNGGDTKRVNRA